MPVCFKTATGGGAPFSLDPSPSSGAPPRTDFASCEWVVLTGSDYAAAQMVANTKPDAFDPATAAGFFSFAMGMTICIWAVSYKAGEVIKFVREF